MEQMKKSRSHSGYMSEGHDASSVVSTDIEDASICSDFLFQRGGCLPKIINNHHYNLVSQYTP